MGRCIGVLTAGGDSPGLNAAIRAIGNSGLRAYGMRVIGFRDGFRGLMENRTVPLEGDILSGILTLGGTILGTSRDKPHKMPVGDKVQDMTGVMMHNYRRHNLEALVCIGGGGTQNLTRAVGERRAKELILSGMPFSAVEAERWGLVNRVLPPEELLEATFAIAHRIAANGPISVRQAKQAIHRGLQMSLADGLAFEIEAYNRLVPTADRREGVLAFNERRKPNFQGK